MILNFFDNVGKRDLNMSSGFHCFILKYLLKYMSFDKNTQTDGRETNNFRTYLYRKLFSYFYVLNILPKHYTLVTEQPI